MPYNELPELPGLTAPFQPQIYECPLLSKDAITVD